MSEENQAKNNSEEVDLGQLFKLIGNAFTKLFNFIASIFKGIYKGIILLMLFVYRHFLKFAIAIFIGAAIGGFLEYTSPTVYGANMIVDPNFNSTRQLYNNVYYYNGLAQQKDSVELAKIFPISQQEAASLIGFYIKPVVTDVSLMTKYTQILRSLDSTSRENFTYEKYTKGIEPVDYPVHQIGVASLDNNIYKKLENTIIASITNNKYFKEKQVVDLKNIKRNQLFIEKSLEETDSLLKYYKRLSFAELDKENLQGGTSIVMAQQEKQRNELVLLERKLALKDKLNANELGRLENSEIIKIISNFPDKGSDISEFYQKKYFLFPIAAFLLVFIFLLLKELIRFLKREESKLKTTQD